MDTNQQTEDTVFEQTTCKHENSFYWEEWSEMAQNFISHFYCPDCGLRLDGDKAIELAVAFYA